MEKSKFIKVKCPKQECNNEQIIFKKVSMKVNCLVCGNLIAVPTGGKSEMKTDSVEML